MFLFYVNCFKSMECAAPCSDARFIVPQHVLCFALCVYYFYSLCILR